jgi:hypothetical protein
MKLAPVHNTHCKFHASSAAVSCNLRRCPSVSSTTAVEAQLSLGAAAAHSQSVHWVGLLCSGLVALHCGLPLSAEAAAPIRPGTSPYLEAQRLVSS